MGLGSKKNMTSRPPESWEPLLRLARFATLPLERFLRIEAASGIVLIAAAAVAFALANSPWAELYAAVWNYPLGVQIGGATYERPLVWFVNDGLMTVFFFVAGMEIRRELAYGELSSRSRAMLPLVAAAGGMIAPALLYLALAHGPDVRSGWGVPMATDIAFALGVFALLGKRVTPSLRLLLLTLAVVDDLGAIIVIALFYSSGIAVSGLLVATIGIGGIFLLRWLGVRRSLAYVAPAVVVWAGVYASGIHPTIAGVIVGLLTPVRAWLGAKGVRADIEYEVRQLSALGDEQSPSHARTEALRRIDLLRREVVSPAEALIEKLHPWVAFGIMPVFALANAGVSLSGAPFDPTMTIVAIGIGLGLLIGKPLGILAAIGIAVRLGVAALPRGLGMKHVVALGLVAGIGFTMALFVAQLAFEGSPLLGAAKAGVLAGSAAAAVVGIAVGLVLLPKVKVHESVDTADEAESSAEG
jgi:NhaA family Na+:H+ antiporter